MNEHYYESIALLLALSTVTHPLSQVPKTNVSLSKFLLFIELLSIIQ